MTFKDEVDPKRLSEWFIRDELLPFTIQSLLDVLVEGHTYVSGRRPQWTGWPESVRQSSSEDDNNSGNSTEPHDANDAFRLHVQLADYINGLIKVAQSLIIQELMDNGAGTYKGRSVRRWSGRYASKSVKDRSHRREHIVLLDSSGVDVRATTWYDVLVTLKYKSNKKHLENAVNDVWSVASSLFASKARRFVLGVAMAGREMQLVAITHSAVLVSVSFDFHEHPRMFLRIVVGLAFLDRLGLGFDTSVTYPLSRRVLSDPTSGECQTKLNPSSIKFKGKTYNVIELLNKRPRSIRERGAACYLVEDPGTGEHLVIKDAWVGESRGSKEHEVRQVLSGIDHVIEFIDEEVVELGDGCHSTKTLFDEFCSTTKKEDQVVRVHRRSLMGTSCRSILTFRSRKELVNGFINWVEALREYHEKYDVTHRDISPNNLMFKEDSGDKNSIGEGILIDFDFAIDVKKHFKTATGERSGTIPFIARVILDAWHEIRTKRNPRKRIISISHTVEHDLESVFYVFLWLCTVIAGPRFTPRASKSFVFEEIPIYSWFSEENLYNVSSAKLRQISMPDAFETEILDYIHIYFGNDFKDCAREFRDLFYPRNRESNSSLEERYAEQKKPFPPLCHESFLEILRHLEQKLPSVETEIPQEEGAEDYKERIHGIPYCYSSIVDEKVEEILYAVDQADPGSDSSSTGHPGPSSVATTRKKTNSTTAWVESVHPMTLRKRVSAVVSSSGKKRKGAPEEPVNKRSHSSSSKRLRSNTGPRVV